MVMDQRVRRSDIKKAYRREHPLALWFSLGIGIVGLVALVHPQAVEETAASQALPDLVKKAFYVCYMLGGFSMWWGLHTVRLNFEAAGEVILSAALLAQFATIVYLRPVGALAGLFVLTLSIGCARRAWHITHTSNDRRGA